MTKALVLAVGVALLCAAFASAAVEEVFSATDSNRVRDSINAAQKDGWWGNARKTHYAVASLKALDASVAQRDKVCSALSKALNAKDAAVEEVYHAIAAIESLACDTAIPESAKKALSSGLAADNLQSILFALQAIEAAAPRKRLNFDDFDVSNVAARVMELAEDDDTGLFRPNADADDANAVNAGRAMSVLGSVYRARHELDNSLAAHVRSVSGEKLKTLLTQGTAKGVDFGAGSDVSGLVAAATVLQGVNALATALSEQLNVPEYAMDDVCDFLVENKYASSLEDVYYLLSGLNICADNAVRVPLVLTVTPAAKAGDAPSQVRVTNVLDAFATKAKVVLSKAQTDSDDDDAATTTVAENVELSAAAGAKNVLYTLAPAGGKAWAPNFYLLKFAVTPASGAGSDRFGQERISKRIKVSAAYTPAKVELFTSETAKGAAEGKTESVAYPSSGPTVSAAAGKYFQAKVHFAPASSRPAQVFFVLTPLSADANANGKAAKAAGAAAGTAGNRKQSIHVATNSAGDDFYALRLDLGSAEVADSLSGNGKYMVELFVGDALLPKPVLWTVATLELTGLSTAGKAGASAGAVDWFAPKADIAHAFRAAEDRPSKLLALIFTALVLLPLVALLSQLMGWKLNMALPTDALEASATFVFQSLLLATLLTMVVYWCGLNIFQALVMLAVLTPFTVFFGHRSLKLLHARKLKDRAAALQVAAATGVAASAQPLA